MQKHGKDVSDHHRGRGRVPPQDLVHHDDLIGGVIRDPVSVADSEPRISKAYRKRPRSCERAKTQKKPRKSRVGGGRGFRTSRVPLEQSHVQRCQHVDNLNEARTHHLDVQGRGATKIVGVSWFPEVHSDRRCQALEVGCDFAGISTTSCALELMGIPVKHVFMSEKDPKCLAMLKHKWPLCGQWYTDVRSRVNLSPSCPSCNVYVTTPPCQSFSLAGLRGGTADPRGALYRHSLEYIRAKRPKLVVWENVAAMLNFKELMAEILTTLESLGYTIVNKQDCVYNCCAHGIPQNRKRVIMVAVRPLVNPWKAPKPFKTCPQLELFLDGPGAVSDGKGWSDLPDKMQGFVQRQVAECRKRRSVDSATPIVVEVAATQKFSSTMVGRMPCITATRGSSQKAFFVTSKDACASIEDFRRLFGIPKTFYSPEGARISRGQWGRQLGNSVPINLLMRVLGPALHAAGLVAEAPPDFWRSFALECKRQGLSRPV